MTDQYAVIGNPIAHSKSPQIHAAFAKQTNQNISYEAILVGVGPNEFEEKIGQLIADGYKGLNVTVPFKFNALLFVAQQGTVNPLANRARAVNTLTFKNGDIIGNNTDGIGLVRDVEKNLNFKIAGKRVLILGSGGAAFGVLQPVANANPSRVVISNRTFAKAEEAARILSEVVDTSKNKTVCIAKQFDQLGDEAFDLVINSTSTGLTDTALPIPDSVFAKNCLAYDMMYGRETPFMAQARETGAQVADGLGMLVEQAAEAFYIWRGVLPETAPVIAELRN
ncbi:MAG: shikimate dehydrogenase [Methylophilaceae bacterium]